jgi:hypothetical protein
MHEAFESSTQTNLARYLFLDARSRGFYADWQTVARDTAAALRIEAGCSSYDHGLTDPRRRTVDS